MRLQDKIAIVTGSTGGIGQAIAINFAKEGAYVVINGRNAERAKAVSDQIKAMGRQSLVVIADVMKGEEVDKMVKTTLERLGRIDILVNNAGGSARARASLFHESTEDVWDFVIGTNLKGVMICTKAVIKHMMERHTGNIVNISSIAGVIGAEGLADYSAAKAGVIGFTKALAKEVGSYGIRVNAVSPEGIVTQGISQQVPQLLEKAKQKILLGRLGQPEDVAKLVTFLVSDDADFITGQNVIISGGANIH